MKKIRAFLIIASFICLAGLLTSCGNKTKKVKYEEPPTEVISFDNGQTAVYEIVTDQGGETVTDEEGETKYVPYVPPVTDKDGYLAQEADNKQGKNATEKVAIEYAAGSLDDDETAPPAEQTTAPAKEETTAAEEKTTKVSAPVGGNAPESTTAASTKNEKTTAAKPETTTEEFFTVKEITGSLSKKKAQKLESILSFDNEFEEALVAFDYPAAEAALPGYIKKVKAAAEEIKADKDLYEFVTDENLSLWVDKIIEAEEEYKLFMALYNYSVEKGEKTNAYYTSFREFQRDYQASLRAYHHMLVFAEEYA